MRRLLAAILLLGWGASAQTNSITIKNYSASTQTNYPVQFSRPFKIGEIANCPQAVISGTPLTTQANVKSVWGDGSVRHAVIAFLIPSFTGSSTVTVTFQNQASCNTTALTKTQMLDAAYNFDAQVQAFSTSVSARTMLTNDHYTVWNAGSVAQTIILADHSQGATCNAKPCSTYDQGNNTYKPFRPIFYATFWPTINKVQLRYTGEISSTETLDSQSYSLTLTAGNSSPATVFTQATVNHRYGARWSVSRNNQGGQTWSVTTPSGSRTILKEIWIGGDRAPSAINHNIQYLAATKMIPNFDHTVTVPEGTLDGEWTSWLASTRTLFGQALYASSQVGGGYRGEIGITTLWIIHYLYSGDIRSYEIANGMAELGGGFTYHYREGKTANSRKGKPVFVNTRPTLNQRNDDGESAGDMILPSGSTSITYTFPGWDLGHHPDSWSMLYLVTGEHHFLEEMQMLSSHVIAMNEPNGTYGRPASTGVCAATHVQIREHAWSLRDLAYTAALTPDGSDKTPYETCLNQSLATEYGMHNVTAGHTLDTDYSSSFTFGRSTLAASNRWWTWSGGTQTPTLHQYFIYNDDTFSDSAQQSQYGINASITNAASQFENHYVTFVWGLIRDLGYQAGAMMTYLSGYYVQFIMDHINGTGANAYLLSNGRIAGVKSGGSQVASFAELSTFYTTDSCALYNWATITAFPTNVCNAGSSTAAGGYATWARAAVAQMWNETNGTTAWNWINTAWNVSDSGSDSDPKWNVVARIAATGPTITTSSLAGGTVGVAYSQTVSATDGSTPYTWSVSAGSLPTGLSLNSSSGAITGTPSGSPGTTMFTIMVTDNASATDTQDLSITISAGGGGPTSSVGVSGRVSLSGRVTVQ